ncbi:MAG: hypothetical protein A2144_11780 [Chloroflexi bacterium RBG_16_50_9]|nr:MAG: hypothetical protein A2144_11780 [Chloroflexi bacterium RBG_16_50_9]
MKKALPPIVLFFLSPAIGELLSGSSPPAEFFSPFGLTLMALTFFILFAPVQELSKRTRPDNTAGMALVGLAALVLLTWLYRKTRRRLQGESNG